MSVNKWEQEYQDCLEYIDSYWEKIIRKPERRRINRKLITIPAPYVVPNDKKFNFLFYWDSYFMSQGLIGTKRDWVLKPMVKNFVYLFKKHHIIPNFNAEVSLGRSQPPFLSSMILDTYESMLGKKHFLREAKRTVFRLASGGNLEKEWLANMFEIAKQE